MIESSSIVLQSIDLALSRFGQSVATVVYWKFQYDTKLRKEDVIVRPDLLTKTMNEIFKDGAFLIERAIISEIKTQFRLPNRNYKDLEDILTSVRLRNL